MDKTTEDPETARYLRKKQQRHGDDDEEDAEDANFHENPTKMASKYGRKKTVKSLEKQVMYFGNSIEPFHMQQEDNMGEFDGDGFFLFNHKKRVRDPWLDSVGQAEDEEVADRIAKRIKTESRFQSVYEATDEVNERMKESEQEEEEDEDQKQKQEEEEENKNQVLPDGDGLTVREMIELMIELIPDNGNANRYMKKLKADKEMEEYNRILALTNEYIEKTNQYDILTKNKQQLQEMLDKRNEQESEQEQLNWDDASAEQEQPAGANKQEEDNDNDNIFD